METSLRARIRDGDPVAFGQIFDAHARVVYSHAVRWTGDWAAAEDVVSLTYLEAWRLRKKLFPGDDSLRPWLLGIATNVLRNTTRAARRHRNALNQLPPLGAVPDFSDELVGRLADTEQLVAARTALQHLSAPEREVFALCVWSGLEHAAVAEALGVPVGTVRSRLSRARHRLRELTERELAQELGRVTEIRQRETGSGQIPGDRASAVRSIQEKNR
jgi:RNA polymerase sigma-70 factor, ECF subfamily